MSEHQQGRTVDAYVEGVPEPLRGVAAAVRDAVRSAAPEARESIKWGQPVWESNGPFAALKAHPRWVTLTFWRGTELPDPNGLLSGDGKQMRHARYDGSSEVDAAAVAELVRAAVALNAELGSPTRRGGGG